MDSILSKTLPSVDPDMVDYIFSMLNALDEADLKLHSVIRETLEPFAEDLEISNDVVDVLVAALVTENGGEGEGSPQFESAATENSETTSLLRTGLVIGEAKITEEEELQNAFLWGSDYREKTNEEREAFAAESARDRRKAKQAAELERRAYDAKMRIIEEEEAQNSGKVAAMVLPVYSKNRERDVQVQNVSLSLDSGKQLLDSADVKFTYQRRYGLVGKNGIGKTTLLKAIAAFEIEGFPRHHRVLHVRQEIKGTNQSVIDTVLEADVERNMLIAEEKEISSRLDMGGDEGGRGQVEEGGGGEGGEKKLALRRAQLQAKMKVDDVTKGDNEKFNEDLKRLDEIYARLEIIGGNGAEARAAMILSGLQFTPEMQSGPTSALSGGWRMRVSLAASLFIEPDILMLDEPTNHLDLEAVLWLESYLLGYKHSLVVVSHDRGFLNSVTTDIIEFKNLKLNYFKGNYDTYVKTSSEALKNQKRVYEAYKDKRADMMEFIEKFRFNAKRASLVQSRIKAVEKMDLEAPDDVEIETLWRFSIENPPPLGRPVIAINDVDFDYDSEKPKDQRLLRKVNFGIDLSSKIGILGPNGAGKSTLLNLVEGKLRCIRGDIIRNGNLRTAYFTQHSADKFDLTLSCVENLLQQFEHATDQEMRSWLGRFQIQGVDAVKPMMMLSGGQKSRVAFAALCFRRPHIIIMDEPTNHLDMESIDALISAVSEFRGGLVVVSHDQYFIQATVEELWVVGEGVCKRFRGSFDDYKKETLTLTKKRVAESVKSLSNNAIR